MKKLTQMLQLASIRATFGLLALLSPQKAAVRAWQMMSTPRSFPPKLREQTILAKATQSSHRYNNGLIQLYRWGEGPRTILLVHGWEGRAGNFGGLVQPLLDQGWSVLAFDAPSHGQSDQQPTSMFDFIECLKEVVESHTFEAMVAHSFGCVATATTLGLFTEISIDKMILVASPNRFEDRLQQIVHLFHLSPKVTEALRGLIKSKVDYPIFDFSVSQLSSQIDAGARLLLHDKGDKVSLFEWSKEIAQAWSQDSTAHTTLIPIEGTGHYRILWDNTTITHISRFLSEPQPALADQVDRLPTPA